MHERARELISTLEMRPHPEGGYYREVYRSIDRVMPGDGRGERAALTTIYFLLVEGTFSRWHQVDSDEVWHLYEGGPLELLELTLGQQSITVRRPDERLNASTGMSRNSGHGVMTTTSDARRTQSAADAAGSNGRRAALCAAINALGS